MSDFQYTQATKEYLREPRMTILLSGVVTTPTGLAVTKEMDPKKEKQILPRVGRNNGESSRVLIPGTNFGGALRRALMDDIVAARAAAGAERPYKSLHGFFSLRVGGVGGFPQGVEIGYDINLRAVNPFISLWGKAGIGGRFGICSADALDGANAVAIEHGYRGNDLRRSPETIEMLSPEMIREYKALMVGSKKKKYGDETIKAFDTGDFKKVEELYGALINHVESSDEDGENTARNGRDDKGIVPIQNPWSGYEYFVPGTRFRHKMSLHGVTETEAALAVGALYAFSRNPRLGGHWRAGLGWVESNYDAVLLSPDPLRRQERAGTLRIRCPLDSGEGFDEDSLEPAFSVTGRLRELLDRYIEMRAAGFPGFDFEAGADEDRKASLVNRKPKTSTRRDKSKSTANPPKEDNN